jgi:hypothetical protein
MDGDANQNDITGAIGTPAINRDEMTGITEHEQNGAMAPTRVAIMMPIAIFFFKMLLILSLTPMVLINTDNGIVTNNKGHILMSDSTMKAPSV